MRKKDKELEEPEIKKIADVLVMNDASSDGTGQTVREWIYRVKVGAIDDEKTA